MKLIKILMGTAMLLGVFVSGGCQKQITEEINGSPDGISAASVNHYTASSLTKEELFEAIRQAEGGCTIATVNEDGSPNLIVAVPGIADENHILFGWADNGTKANIQRDKQAFLCYYIYHKEASAKENRYQGARLRVTLEEDQTVINTIFANHPEIPAISTILRIDEILPLG